MLELRFTGFDASFIVILPNEIDGLDVLVEKLKDPSALKLATSQMSEYDVNVSLPKFKIETTTDLRNVLEKVSIVDNVTKIIYEIKSNYGLGWLG